MDQKIGTLFRKYFGTSGVLYAAPGRVNMIGEHTDYNLGFVLPGAIDQAIYFEIRSNGTNHCRIFSVDYNESVEFDTEGTEKPTPQWAQYIYGVAREMARRGGAIGGFDAVFGGNVPLGAGLSSSAALESVIGFALNDLFSLNFDRRLLAEIGQATEHRYIGVQCGIMDQFASLFGEKGELILLDCRSLEYELVPFNPLSYRVLLLDTQVKHSLASSEYNVRRAQCEQGVAVVARHEPDVASLRDVTHCMLDRYRKEMDAVVYRRCRYILDENQRVLEGCEALKRSDYQVFGQKLFESHEGQRDEFEISCPELDFLAEKARNFDGVLGARMTGGGFGGCTINIVQESVYEEFISELSRGYQKTFGLVPRAIDVVISDGARRIR